MNKILVTVLVFITAVYLFNLDSGLVDRDFTDPVVDDVPTIVSRTSNQSLSKNESTKPKFKVTKNKPVSETVDLEQLNRIAQTKIPGSASLAIKQVRYRMAATPNDPYVGQDWEAQIGLAVARDEPLGGYTPKVAVIDGGFALEHEDLIDQWLTNGGESGSTSSEAVSIYNCSDQSIELDLNCNVIDDDLNGIIDDESGPTSIENQSLLNCTDQSLSLDKSCNLIDDDGNGLVDDYIGFDFVNYDRSVSAGETNPSGDGVSHGSLVTGVLAATNNNTTGLAGVADQVEVLPIQVLDDDGLGYTVSVADGIIYAVSRGVDVINLSLGSDIKDSYIELAIDYATEQGVIVVASAGNDGCDCDFYPAAYKPVVSVGSTNNSQQLAIFSNYGSELDVVAPGLNILTTGWSITNELDLYQYASGTSMSAPIVSGVFSRLVSYQPDASPIELKALVHESTDKSMLNQTEYRNNNFGYGFLSADTSVQRAITPLTSNQVVGFDLVRSGSGLSDEYSRQEVAADTVVYACKQPQKPATTVYKLSKSGKLAYTVSEQEVEAAKRAGFNTSAMFDACILQSHDAPVIIRSINTALELNNLNIKNIYW